MAAPASYRLAVAASVVVVVAIAGLPAAGALGVNWGTMATHQLPPDTVVRMLGDNGIRKVKQFDADPGPMDALAGSGVEVMVAIPNNMLDMMTDYGTAKDWVHQNVSRYNFDGGVKIKMISYAACLEGTDVVRLFDRRISARREPGFVFDKACLLSYNHMSFGGGPLEVGTEEEAEKLTSQNEKDSANEAEVLSAPPKLVYNNFVLRLSRELLVAVASGWDKHVDIIDKIIPQAWKDEPVARILELCILHIAMAEMTSKGTPHKVVINEAVDLAKRFCDGGAPRVINGCLRTFVKDHVDIAGTSQPAESKA